LDEESESPPVKGAGREIYPLEINLPAALALLALASHPRTLQQLLRPRVPVLPLPVPHFPLPKLGCPVGDIRPCRANHLPPQILRPVFHPLDPRGAILSFRVDGVQLGGRSVQFLMGGMEGEG